MRLKEVKKKIHLVTEVNMKLCRMVGFFLNVIQFCVNVANQLDKIKFQA